MLDIGVNRVLANTKVVKLNEFAQILGKKGFKYADLQNNLQNKESLLFGQLSKDVPARKREGGCIFQRKTLKGRGDY